MAGFAKTTMLGSRIGNKNNSLPAVDFMFTSPFELVSWPGENRFYLYSVFSFLLLMFEAVFHHMCHHFTVVPCVESFSVWEIIVAI